MTNRLLAFAYGLVAYAIFLGTFLYAVGFIGNFAVPTTLDGPARSPVWQAHRASRSPPGRVQRRVALIPERTERRSARSPDG